MNNEEIKSAIEALRWKVQQGIIILIARAETDTWGKEVQDFLGLYSASPKFFPPHGGIPQFSPITEERWSTQYVIDYFQSIQKEARGMAKYAHRLVDITIHKDFVIDCGTYSIGTHDCGNEEGVYQIIWGKGDTSWKIVSHVLITNNSIIKK